MSKAVFTEEFCSPMKHVEHWLRSKRKEFGTLAECPAFKRVEAFLMSGKARIAVLGCMKTSMKLEGCERGDPRVHCQCFLVQSPGPSAT